ncbi:hypothetical protein HPB47_004777, partial [Ixodes persulcatus]
ECHLKNAKRAIRATYILHNTCEKFRDRVEQQWEHEALGEAKKSETRWQTTSRGGISVHREQLQQPVNKASGSDSPYAMH